MEALVALNWRITAFFSADKMTDRLASKQDIDRSEEAFSLLREELARSLMLIRKYHFDHLVRLTDYAERTISVAQGANKITPEITSRRQS